jgi:DNA-directed RNA polymerase subunit RPC12/RpoP
MNQLGRKPEILPDWLKRIFRICEEPGCHSRNVVICRILADDCSKDIFYFYCREHCFKNGFCYWCGNFWAGCENFDFDPSHLCSNCRDEFEADLFYDEDRDYYCPTCGGEGIIITCCDDICIGGGHCIHGDGEEICPDCGGNF